VRKPQVVPDEDHEVMYERVAAVNVAKASGVACMRTPDSSGRAQISYEAACQTSALPAPDSCTVMSWFVLVCGGGSGARRQGLRATGPERRRGWS